VSDRKLFARSDETMHRVDPGVAAWNESWFFSWIDLDGGPAGFFRSGVMPNQNRAMLWCFVHVADSWLAIEESRLDFGDLDLAAGIGYDKWALQFAWEPAPPLRGARFTAAGSFLARSGPRAGAIAAVSIDLSCTATSECFGTGASETGEVGGDYPAARFEQSLEVYGSVTVDGEVHPVRSGGHRDRSWGPREWRQPFALGDVQSERGQLYFVGQPSGLGMAYLREPGQDVRHFMWAGANLDYDDDRRTLRSGRLELAGAGEDRLSVELTPIGPSVAFDMAHTCEEPEYWLYWRTLVEARVTGWDAPERGWFEASRYGSTQTTPAGT
jgi:hypothetical protein